MSRGDTKFFSPCFQWLIKAAVDKVVLAAALGVVCEVGTRCAHFRSFGGRVLFLATVNCHRSARPNQLRDGPAACLLSLADRRSRSRLYRIERSTLMKDSSLVMFQQQNRRREGERIHQELVREDYDIGLESLSTRSAGANSLFGEPIKQRHDDETSRKIKSAFGSFDSVQSILVSNQHCHLLIGISTSEVSRIKSNKAKIEQILSEMKVFSPITGLEDVGKQAHVLPQLKLNDLTSHTLSDNGNSRPNRPNTNSLPQANSNNLPSASKPRISFNGYGQNRKGDSITTCSSLSSSSSLGSSDSYSESASAGSALSSGYTSVNDDLPSNTDERRNFDSASQELHSNSGNINRSRQASLLQPKESSPTVPSWKLSSFVPPSLQEKKEQIHSSTSEKSGPKMNSISQIIESVAKGRGNSISPSLSSPSISSDSPASSRLAKKRKSSSPIPDTSPMDTAPRPKVPRKTGAVMREEPNRDSPPSSLPPKALPSSSSSSSSNSTSASHNRLSSKADPRDSAANHNDHQQPPHHLHHSHHKSKTSSSSSSSSSHVTQSRSLNDGHSRSSTNKNTSKSHHSSKRSEHKENLDEFPSSKSPQHIICSISLGRLRRIPNVSSNFESHCKEVKNVKGSSKQHSSLPETTHNEVASSEQESSEHYLSKAKRIKHEADKETKKTARLSKYLKAGSYFILAATAMEEQLKKNSQDQGNVQSLYSETLQLIRQVSSRFSKKHLPSVDVSVIEYTLATLSLRCQSLLYLKLYKLNKSNEVSTGNKILHDLTPEEITPSTLSLPARDYSVMQHQLFLYNYLSASHELWAQADHLEESNSACKDFFLNLGKKHTQPLSFLSSLNDLVKYVNIALKISKCE